MSDLNPIDIQARRARRWAPWIVAAGEFVDGYDLLVIGAAILFLKPTFHLSSGTTGLVTAISFIGCAAGVLVAGESADRIGRRAVFVFNLLFFVVAAILSALATNVGELLVTRFFVGFGVGLDIPTSSAFLAEMAPRGERGRLSGSLPNMMWLLGAATSVILTLAIRGAAGINTWRWLFGVAALPAVAILFTRRWLPESPRWLMVHGHEREAREVADRLGLTIGPVVPDNSGSRYRQLFTGAFGRRVMIVTAIFAFNGFGGGIATVAGPEVIKSAGIGTAYALEFSLGGFVIGLLGVLLGMRIIDRVNRVHYGVWTVLGMVVAAQGMTWLGERSSAALFAFYILYSFMSWFGPGVLTWVWSSEVFPTRVRSLGAGVTQAACRLALAANVAAIPALLSAVGLKAVAIYSTAYLLCLAGILTGARFLANTGRDLEHASGEPLARARWAPREAAYAHAPARPQRG
jgi:putative MFS transporter